MIYRVSVIIPSYNSSMTIEKTLVSIHSQTLKESIADVIVADSSDDGVTQQTLSRHESEGVRVIRAGVKVMPAVARNLGSKLAKGDTLVFVDADAYMADNFIENVIQARQKGVKAGGGSVLLPDFQKWDWIAAAQYFLQFNEFMPAGSPRIVRFSPSCNLFCEKELFEKVGGFPEIRAAEDVLFGIAVNKQDRLWFFPGQKVYHIFRRNLRAMAANQVLLGKYVILYRRLAEADKFYYQKLWPLLFLPAFLAIKLIRISARVFRGGSTASLRYLLSFPVFILGLFFWTLGFIRGVFSDKP